MTHIDTKNDWPGIMSLLKFRPETAGPMNKLAEALLRSEEFTLSRAERELVFAAASFANDCEFCSGVHSQCALLEADAQRNENWSDLIASLSNGAFDPDSVPDPRLRSMISIAFTVCELQGEMLRGSMRDEVAQAKKAGLSDKAIHDVVLIASSACMFNRYVDALATPNASPEMLRSIASILTTNGYDNPLP